MNVEVRLQLFGPLDPIGLTWQTAEAVLEQVPFGEDEVQTRYNLLLALQEAVTNVFRHGYEAAPSERDWIEVRIRYTGEKVVLEVRDEAPAFDPTTVEELRDPNADEDLPLMEGGYGMHIIRSVVDGLGYRREGSENVLVLEKDLVPAAQATRR